MKKLNRAFCFILAFVLLCFPACGKEEKGKVGAGKEINFEADKYSRVLTSFTANEKGAYIIESPERKKESGTSVVEIPGEAAGEKAYSLIKFIDNVSLKEVVLCNKPGCTHRDSSCNARVMSPFNAVKGGDGVRLPMMNSVGYIFALGGKLYTFDPMGDVTVVEKDGTQHRKLLTVDGKYKIEKAYLYKGKLYLDVRYLPPFDSDREEVYSDKDHNVALLEIDLEKKACKELFAFKVEPETEIIGIYENKAYYFYKSPNKLISAHNQQAVDNEENSHDVRLFSYDLSSGEKAYIKKDIKSYELDNPVLIENSVYYHNRKNAEFIALSLDSGESKAVISDFSGYIEYFSGNTFFDNKLFFIKNNQLAYAYADPPKENETYYIDITTNEVGKVGYTNKSDGGLNVSLRSFRAATDDYYILYGKEGAVAVRKEDFHNNKQNFIPVK